MSCPFRAQEYSRNKEVSGNLNVTIETEDGVVLEIMNERITYVKKMGLWYEHLHVLIVRYAIYSCRLSVVRKEDYKKMEQLEVKRIPSNVVKRRFISRRLVRKKNRENCRNTPVQAIALDSTTEYLSMVNAGNGDSGNWNLSKGCKDLYTQ